MDNPINPILPVNDISKISEGVKMQKEILWSLYQENRVHARHKEVLRSNLTTILIAASAGLVTIITLDKQINQDDLVPSVLLMLLGIISLLLSVAHTERFNMHLSYAYEIQLEINKLFSLSGAETSLKKLQTDAEDYHFGRYEYRLIRKIARNNILWSLFPLIIIILGAVLTVKCWATQQEDNKSKIVITKVQSSLNVKKVQKKLPSNH